MRRSHCKHGHELTEANTYVSPDGKHRACRQCRSARAKVSQQRPEYREWYRAYIKRWGKKNPDRIREYVRKRRDESMAWMREYRASLSCATCGESDPVCLDFHHRDPAHKEFTVMTSVRVGWSRVRILAELAKCDVLCSNCHRKHHAAVRAMAS